MKQGVSKRKLRGVELRNRKPIIFMAAEGKNKTETLYFKAYGQDISRNIRFAPGTYTDPVNMVVGLRKYLNENDFSPDLGDKAYCLIDADVDPKKNASIAHAEKLALEQG